MFSYLGIRLYKKNFFFKIDPIVFLRNNARGVISNFARINFNSDRIRNYPCALFRENTVCKLTKIYAWGVNRLFVIIPLTLF